MQKITSNAVLFPDVYMKLRREHTKAYLNITRFNLPDISVYLIIKVEITIKYI